jgi:CspA family cold shock protein
MNETLKVYICGITNFNFLLPMKTGTIKFFNNAKGFGFIKDDESNEEIFIHVTGLVDQVREADRVSYDVRDGKRGINAFNVKKID